MATQYLTPLSSILSIFFSALLLLKSPVRTSLSIRRLSAIWRLFRFLPTYEIYIDGRLAATIIKRFTFFRPSYVIRDCNWRVEGNFLAHDYSMYDGNGHVAATIHKTWFTIGDCFELDVRDRKDELLAVCMMLAIDCVMDDDAAAASANTATTSN